jgi:hypothetical protein
MLKTVGNPSLRSGDQTIVNGNVVIGTAAKGVDFSASSNNPGMTSELLNDYEEGLFTPGLSFGGASTGITYDVQRGIYTKIGRLVTYHIYIGLTSKGSATGNASITGIPFAPETGGAAYYNPTIYMDAAAAGATGHLQGGLTSGGINLAKLSAGSNSALTDADFNNNTYVIVTGQYFSA